MFCRKCGTQLADGALFCGNCGTKVETEAAPQQSAYDIPQQPAYDVPQQSAYDVPQQNTYTAPQPSYAPQQPVYVAPQQSAPANDPYLDDLAGSVLARGITGLALAAIGVPGIIVSAKAKNLAAEYAQKAGGLSGRAKVGSILARVGFPLGWGMTGFYVLYAIILMAAMM